VHGPTEDEPIVWYEGSGVASRRWLHADERGSIVAVSNVSGVAFAINRFDEYGQPAATNAGRFQFTGQLFIAEINLYYFKARFYTLRSDASCKQIRWIRVWDKSLRLR